MIQGDENGNERCTTRAMTGSGDGMARPREFDEAAVVDAAIECFWSRGYESTSVKDLVDSTGISAASLYNAYGDKRGVFRVAFDCYVENRILERLRRCEVLPPRQAIGSFFDEILARSLNDDECKGCMLVNSALEMAPHDPEFQKCVADALARIEAFFRQCIDAGQVDGTVTRLQPAEILARHLLGVLIGVRVLARVRPERTLLEGVIMPALGLLAPSEGELV